MLIKLIKVSKFIVHILFKKSIYHYAYPHAVHREELAWCTVLCVCNAVMVSIYAEAFGIHFMRVIVLLYARASLNYPFHRVNRVLDYGHFFNNISIIISVLISLLISFNAQSITAST